MTLQVTKNSVLLTVYLFTYIIKSSIDLAESIITLFCKRESNLKNPQSLKIILNLLSKQLRKLEHFNNFLNFNRIDNFTLRNAIKQFHYEQYPSGTQLFQQGEPAYKFYCIIRGTVSFKENKHSHNIDSPTEPVELYQYSDGRCFNERNVLYEKNSRIV